MLIEIENLNLDELLTLRKQLDADIDKQKNRVMLEIAEKMKIMNINIKELSEVADTGKVKTKSLPKYRNPDNPLDVWTGKGKHPKWYDTASAKGIEKEDMLIR